MLVFHSIMIDVSSVNRLNLKNSNISTTLCDFSFSSLLNIEYVDPSMNELFGSILPRIGKISRSICCHEYRAWIWLVLKSSSPPLERKSLDWFNSKANKPASLGNLSLHFFFTSKHFFYRSNHLPSPSPPTLHNLNKLENLFLFQNNIYRLISVGVRQLKSLLLILIRWFY